ncbi:MAG: RNA polymerase sigma factor [candidate division WOR-3 bacterium]|nr:RNA polymerase sigma factor [candidate division WOR-3 bacterium]
MKECTLLGSSKTAAQNTLDSLLRGYFSMSTEPRNGSSNRKMETAAGREELPSDADLLAGVRAGDTQACRVIVERYQRLLYSISYKFLGDHGEADDAVQQVFIRFFEKAGRLRRAKALKTYLARSVTNECIDRLRRIKRRQTVSLEELGAAETLALEDGQTPQKSAERKELAALIQWALGQLSLRQRRVVVLSVTEGLSYAEIAEVLGCEEVTVRTHLHRARKRLQKLLGPRLHDLEAGFVRKG